MATLASGTPPDPLEAGQASMTVVIVDDPLLRRGAAGVVARLAELAVADELLVVYGLDESDLVGVHSVVMGLRGLLPRHSIVVVCVGPDPGSPGRDGALLDGETALIGDLMDVGSLPVVVTPTEAVPAVATGLSDHLRADRVLRMSCSPKGGVNLQPESVTGPAGACRAA